jgi:hypothetical protein
MRTVEEKALTLFKWIRKSGKVMPNEYNLDCVLRLKLGAHGMAVHGIFTKFGLECDQ